MRVFVLCLILIVLGLQYKLWLKHDSVMNWFDLQQKLQAQLLENKQLRARNQAIRADIVELKSNDQALEEHARAELGMIKPDETYYQFVD